MSQRLKTFLQVWCLLTVILFLLGFYFTEDKSSRSYLYHVAVEQPEDLPVQEVTEFHPDTRKILYGDNQQCRLRKKIIFAKTHKTGSTTLQNIVFRFGQEHQLLFVLPKSGTHYFNLRSHFRTSMADLYKLYKNVRSELSPQIPCSSLCSVSRCSPLTVDGTPWRPSLSYLEPSA